jgi:3-phenylpropionate/cinnamic acid dioxygenase small subunit
MSIDELSDRIEIQDLLVRYATALDTKDWALLDTCFTADGWVDYTSSGGIAGPYSKARRWLEKALAAFPVTVHMVGNVSVTITGDAARSTAFVLNPMRYRNPDGSLHPFTVGAYYHDVLVRTVEGWKIAERREVQSFMDGTLPGSLDIPK